MRILTIRIGKGIFFVNNVDRRIKLIMMKLLLSNYSKRNAWNRSTCSKQKLNKNYKSTSRTKTDPKINQILQSAEKLLKLTMKNSLRNFTAYLMKSKASRISSTKSIYCKTCIMKSSYLLKDNKCVRLLGETEDKNLEILLNRNHLEI